MILIYYSADTKRLWIEQQLMQTMKPNNRSTYIINKYYHHPNSIISQRSKCRNGKLMLEISAKWGIWNQEGISIEEATFYYHVKPTSRVQLLRSGVEVQFMEKGSIEGRDKTARKVIQLSGRGPIEGRI